MGYAEVREPFAAAPRIALAEPDHDLPGVAPERHLVLDGARLADARIDAVDLEIESSKLTGVVVGAPTRVDASWTAWRSCDLSGARIDRLRECVLADSKLVGTDLSEADLIDVAFERCQLSLANLRMARLRRVAFVDCQLADVDCLEMAADDVTFDGCTLEEVDVRGVKATRVDLRGARTLGLTSLGRLDGWLVREQQLPELSGALAAALGLGVERLGPT